MRWGATIELEPDSRARRHRVALCAALLWTAMTAEAGVEANTSAAPLKADWLSPHVVHAAMPPLPLLDIEARQWEKRPLPVVIVHGRQAPPSGDFGPLPRVVIVDGGAAPSDKEPVVVARTPPPDIVVGEAALDAQIAEFAHRHGVPLSLARAVVQVESSGNVTAQGKAGEIGLMQIRPTTARLLGFAGEIEELYQPRVNLAFGMAYLGKAYRLAEGDLCGTILRYNAGHNAREMNAGSARYCDKVKTLLGFGPELKVATREP